MLDPQLALDTLQRNGIDFFTGVPDSLLKHFCACITDQTPTSSHVIGANEGNAIALAAGHYLGSARPALVYMQNSGFGNAINPLLSLAAPDVYSIPMLLMIGWRGEPGVKDEPQHLAQGRTMEALLQALDIPYFILESGGQDPVALMSEACNLMHKTSQPIALLVRKGVFSEYQMARQPVSRYPLSREEAIKCVTASLSDDAVIIATTGKTSRELYELRKNSGQRHDQDFLTVGSMGHASSIAMGVAGTRSTRPTVCLDGDGATLMHMGALAIIGQSGLTHFIHVILNNGVHDSVGGQPTVGFGIDIAAIGRACGYRQAWTVSTAADIRTALSKTALNDGPFLLEIRVDRGARTDLGRPTTTPAANRNALMARLAP